MIGQSYDLQKAREEVEKILNQEIDLEHKRLRIGKILKTLANKYGNEVANLIVDEFHLFRMNIIRAD